MTKQPVRPRTPPEKGARLSLRIVFAPGVAIGPGKADLLEGIRETGSIAAAGRRMRMSYKRAWQLVDALNGQFTEPLVRAAKGGARGGGAVLTEDGEAVLTHYRTIENSSSKAAAPELRALERLRPRGT